MLCLHQNGVVLRHQNCYLNLLNKTHGMIMQCKFSLTKIKSCSWALDLYGYMQILPVRDLPSLLRLLSLCEQVKQLICSQQANQHILLMWKREGRREKRACIGSHASNKLGIEI